MAREIRGKWVWPSITDSYYNLCNKMFKNMVFWHKREYNSPNIIVLIFATTSNPMNHSLKKYA
jgi:hypothetical protein